MRRGRLDEVRPDEAVPEAQRDDEVTAWHVADARTAPGARGRGGWVRGADPFAVEPRGLTDWAIQARE